MCYLVFFSSFLFCWGTLLVSYFIFSSCASFTWSSGVVSVCMWMCEACLALLYTCPCVFPSSLLTAEIFVSLSLCTFMPVCQIIHIVCIYSSHTCIPTVHDRFSTLREAFFYLLKWFVCFICWIDRSFLCNYILITFRFSNDSKINIINTKYKYWCADCWQPLSSVIYSLHVLYA